MGAGAAMLLCGSALSRTGARGGRGPRVLPLFVSRAIVTCFVEYFKFFFGMETGKTGAAKAAPVFLRESFRFGGPPRAAAPTLQALNDVWASRGGLTVGAAPLGGPKGRESGRFGGPPRAAAPTLQALDDVWAGRGGFQGRRPGTRSARSSASWAWPRRVRCMPSTWLNSHSAASRKWAPTKPAVF